MLFLKLKLITVISYLTNIGLLCRHVYCLDESPQSYEHGLFKNRMELEQETKGLGMLDKTDKVDRLNLRLNDAPRLNKQNNPFFSNLNSISNVPLNGANLEVKGRHGKPSHKNPEKRNNRISKNAASKSKPISDKVNNKVMAIDCCCQGIPIEQKLQQEPEEAKTENIGFVNPADTQNSGKNLKDGSSESGLNSITNAVNDYINNVDLTQDGSKNNYILPNTLSPKEHYYFTQDINEIDNRILMQQEKFIELLQEQNNILKELLLKIFNNENGTRKASDEADTRRVHLIMDMNNIGSRSFNMELNPILKFKDQYYSGRSNSAMPDNNDWIKFDSKSNSEIDENSNGSENSLSSYAHNNYAFYQYNDPVVDAPTKISDLKEDKPSKYPWNYAYDHSKQQNLISQTRNNVYSSTPNKTNTIATSFNDIARVTPQHSYYNGYYSPIPQLYSKPYNIYQKPLCSSCGSQYNYV